MLAQTVTCLHCSAPVSILSEDSINQTLKELQQKEAKRTTVDPTVAARLVMDQMSAMKHDREMNAPLAYRWSTRGTSTGADLVEVGARALLGLIAVILD